MTASVGVDIEGYRTLLNEVFDEKIVTWTAEAEASERFPRKLIEHLGASGAFRGKWGAAGNQHPDVARLNELAFSLGRLGSAGIGVGVSLRDSAIAASEESGGSDLQIVETEVRSAGEGSRSTASRSSSRCPRSPITSWSSPAVSTTTPAGVSSTR